MGRAGIWVEEAHVRLPGSTYLDPNSRAQQSCAECDAIGEVLPGLCPT